MNRKMLRVCAVLLPAAALFLSACANVAANRRAEADAHYRMANSYLQQGGGFVDETNRRQAYPELVKAIQLDPNNPEYPLFLGTLYLYSRELIMAEREIKKALKLDPNLGDAHNNLGLVYIEQGRFNEAITEFKKAIGNYSYKSVEVAYFNLGRASFLVGNYPEAAESLERSLSILPANEEAQFFLGRSFTKLGNLPSAETAFRAALRLKPDAVRTHYELGVVLFKLGRKDEAAKEFAEVLRIAPESDLAGQAKTYIKLLR